MQSTTNRECPPCNPTSVRRHLGAGPNDEKSATGEENANRRLNLTRRNLKMATWNVRSLKKPGKLENTIQEMTRLNIDIMGLSEIKWSDNGTYVKDNATLYYSGNPASQKDHHHGVGILVKKELARYVTNFLPFSER